MYKLVVPHSEQPLVVSLAFLCYLMHLKVIRYILAIFFYSFEFVQINAASVLSSCLCHLLFIPERDPIPCLEEIFHWLANTPSSFTQIKVLFESDQKFSVRIHTLVTVPLPVTLGWIGTERSPCATV